MYQVITGCNLLLDTLFVEIKALPSLCCLFLVHAVYLLSLPMSASEGNVKTALQNDRKKTVNSTYVGN